MHCNRSSTLIGISIMLSSPISGILARRQREVCLLGTSSTMISRRQLPTTPLRPNASQSQSPIADVAFAPWSAAASPLYFNRRDHFLRPRGISGPPSSSVPSSSLSRVDGCFVSSRGSTMHPARRRRQRIVGLDHCQRWESSLPFSTTEGMDLKDEGRVKGENNIDRTYVLRFDGRADSKSGGSGAGMILYDADSDSKLYSGHRYVDPEVNEDGIQNTTNNAAVYMALVEGLRIAKDVSRGRKEGRARIEVQTGSDLIAKHLSGEYKVSSKNLKPWYELAVALLAEGFDSFEVGKIDRGMNTAANAQLEKAVKTKLSEDNYSEGVTLRSLRSHDDDDNDGVNSANSPRHELTNDAHDTDTTRETGDATVAHLPSQPPVEIQKLSPESIYVLRFDGGSRGNPGIAGAGAVLYDAADGTELWADSRYLEDDATNNEAEYVGLITGLQGARSLGVERIVVQGDSQLVLRQVEGRYKVKSLNLKPYYDAATKLLADFESVQTVHIYREENSRADELANAAMDAKSLEKSQHGSNVVKDARTAEPQSLADERSYREDTTNHITKVQTTRKETASAYSSFKSTGRHIISPNKKYSLYFDGGSRGNPGIAGAGAVLYDDTDNHREVWSGSVYLGDNKTNNEAEYTALIEGLRSAKSLGVTRIAVRGDSQLVLRQVEGKYRVKSPNLKPYFDEAVALSKEFESFQTLHVPRNENGRADELANEAMDTQDSFGFDLDAT